MKEEEIIKKVCEIMEVKYSHYDNHDMSMDYFINDPFVKITSKPKIVVYSSRMGMWQFAILEDMTVITSLSGMSKTLVEIDNMMKGLGIKTDATDGSKSEMIKIEKAEKWLKKNNCQKVINDKRKKIHLEW